MEKIRELTNGKQELTLKTTTKIMECYLLYKRNSQFFDIFGETLGRIKEGEDSTEVGQFFAVAAKACMLTKNGARGS